MALDEFVDGITFCLISILALFRVHFKLWSRYPITSWICFAGICLNTFHQEVVAPLSAPDTSQTAIYSANIVQLVGTYTVVTTAFAAVLAFSFERLFNVVPWARSLGHKWPALRKYFPRVAAGLMLATLYAMLVVLDIDAFGNNRHYIKSPVLRIWLLTRLPFEVLTDVVMLTSDATIMAVVLDNVHRMEAASGKQPGTTKILPIKPISHHAPAPGSTTPSPVPPCSTTPSPVPPGANGTGARHASTISSHDSLHGGTLDHGTTVPAPKPVGGARGSSTIPLNQTPGPSATRRPSSGGGVHSATNAASMVFESTKLFVLIMSALCTVANIAVRIAWTLDLVPLKLATAFSRLSLIVIFGNLLYVGVRRPDAPNTTSGGTMSGSAARASVGAGHALGGSAPVLNTRDSAAHHSHPMTLDEKPVAGRRQSVDKLSNENFRPKVTVAIRGTSALTD
ncbi:hypothetical protein AMAG_01757 [Allomyces macrogynus ATCC 38327]|uniref:Uncharacterized protein n=1 Tax=Allomyces macrogynus (strain ATCC 38327) TaxID=578462 RepID=A0A0L0S0J8_ALLM3|nr:hypothetical protein AMAG_01757 [Allomyces macrogynus ATCC 38327]|eukprot:KNE55891.1 hypothetical protein AMAG_01757 [Allomyces macrogynus ATCC 38327]